MRQAGSSPCGMGGSFFSCSMWDLVPCPGFEPRPPPLEAQSLSTAITKVIPAAAAKSLQSCPTLCDPVDGSPPGSSVPGILQVRTLEWVAISFSNASMQAKLLQLCLTLCNAMDSSPPGSSVHGILQARILEWVAISFSDLIAKSCLILWSPMDHNPPGPSVHGISQARIPEWYSFSKVVPNTGYFKEGRGMILCSIFWQLSPTGQCQFLSSH